MNHKIKNLLIAFSLIIICFFVNINKVEAGRDSTSSSKNLCTWYTYQSYYDGGFIVNNSGTSTNDRSNTAGFYEVNYTNQKYAPSNIIYDVIKIKPSTGSEITLYTPSSDSLSVKITTGSGNCPKYVKMTSNGNNITMQESNVTEFKNYFKTQYSGIKTINGDSLSYKASIFDVDSISKVPVVLTSNTGLSDTPHANEMIKADPDIFNKIFVKSLTSIGIVEIPKEKVSQEFYDSTKGIWNSVISGISENDLNCDLNELSCKHIKIRLSAFKKWFNSTWRSVLEDDYDKFKKYYQYAYYRDLTEEEMKTQLSIIDAGKNISINQSNLNSLYQDKCSAYCPINSGQAQTQCQNTSTQYINCKKEMDYCKEHASNDFETCMKNRLGQKNYEELETKYNERKTEIQLQIENSRNFITSTLSTVEGPTLDINFEPYEIKCEDISWLHTIYVIMRVMTPILVILFGSFDYAKAVMASDEKKMMDSRKKFPKRLLLLVIFILVPVIINAIISVAGTFNSSDSMHLMQCVIKGTDS